MVASLALPASAAAPATKNKVASPVALSVAVAAAPSAAQAPLVPRTFGKIGFTGVAKPKPVAAPVVRSRAAVVVSRSTSRIVIAPTTTPAPAKTVAAPVVVAPSSSGVLGIAASLGGIYYIYGGTTTAGFDCSGFTKYVFAKVGISLPRTAEEQRQAVQSVSDPRPGDLVFFGSPAYHVGIYAGNGMMWDSPETGSAIALRTIWSSNPSYGRP